MFKNVTEIRKALNDSGSYWFTPGTMRGFGSKVHPGVYGPEGRVFVSSEQDPLGEIWDGERRYTVREVHECTPGRDIVSVSEFGEHTTLDDAISAAKSYTA